MSSDEAPKSYFNRPFGSAAGAPPATPSPGGQALGSAALLSQEWEALEARIRSAGPAPDAASLHAEVGNFLRHWGLALAQAPVDQRTALAGLLESARATLMGQLALAADGARDSQRREHENRQRRSSEQAAQQARIEAGQAEVRRLRQETAQIQSDTFRAGQTASERNHQLARAALFPENHCPYCSRAYLDLTGGCWHCQRLHRPGFF